MEIAKRLKQQGVDREVIAGTTGLSIAGARVIISGSIGRPMWVLQYNRNNLGLSALYLKVWKPLF